MLCKRCPNACGMAAILALLDKGNSVAMLSYLLYVSEAATDSVLLCPETTGWLSTACSVPKKANAYNYKAGSSEDCESQCTRSFGIRNSCTCKEGCFEIRVVCMLRGECHHVGTSKSTSSSVIWIHMVARQVHPCKHMQVNLMSLHQGTNLHCLW